MILRLSVHPHPLLFFFPPPSPFPNVLNTTFTLFNPHAHFRFLSASGQNDCANKGADDTHTHFARKYYPLTQRASPVLTLILISRPTKQHCQINSRCVFPTAVSCVFSQLHAPNCAHIGYILVLNAIERPFRACVIKLAMFSFKSNAPRTHKLLYVRSIYLQVAKHH